MPNRKRKRSNEFHLWEALPKDLQAETLGFKRARSAVFSLSTSTSWKNTLSSTRRMRHIALGKQKVAELAATLTEKPNWFQTLPKNPEILELVGAGVIQITESLLEMRDYLAERVFEPNVLQALKEKLITFETLTAHLNNVEDDPVEGLFWSSKISYFFQHGLSLFRDKKVTLEEYLNTRSNEEGEELLDNLKTFYTRNM